MPSSTPTAKNRLSTNNRKVAAEWHPTKNTPLTPKDVAVGSHYRAWWKCSKGHEYIATVNKRSSGRGCAKCYESQRSQIARVGRTKGKPKLDASHPGIAIQWHPTKNVLRSCDVTYGSDVRAWWICKKGHEWEATIGNRVFQNQGCPYCSGNRVHETTSLAVKYPNIAAEWHPTKNESKPSNVTSGSNFEAWWVCSKNHEYLSPVKARVRNRGCPFCSGNRVHETTSLAVKYPNIAAEWHPTKNGKLTPLDVTRGSKIKIWWLCYVGHEWNATVNDRTSGYGCPECWSERGRTHTEFMYLATKIHAGKFDYSQTEYETYSKAIVIGCPFHGYFKQLPDNHIKGYGCRKCGHQRIRQDLTPADQKRFDTIMGKAIKTLVYEPN